jgi:hypothetical protein
MDLAKIINNIPISNVFVLFLIIASNYIGELFPCRVQDLLSSNVYLKHFVAFLTLLFFVVLTDDSLDFTAEEIFQSSMKLYIVFLLLINCNQTFFIYSLGLLCLSYIIKLLLKDAEKDIDDEYKKKKYETLVLLNKIVFIIFFMVLIIGFIIYLGEKKIEYKNNFKYVTFIFGTPKCKGNSPNTNYGESFVSAFK